MVGQRTDDFHALRAYNRPRIGQRAFKEDAKKSNNNPEADGNHDSLAPLAVLGVRGKLDRIGETGHFRKVEGRYIEYVRRILALISVQ